MIFRTKNGKLVRILRANFTNDSEYYFTIASICCGVENTKTLFDIYKTEESNITLIENIINNV